MRNIVLFLCFLGAVLCQTRTPWVYIRGPSTFTPNPYTADQQHGDPQEFTAAVVPDVTDSTIWNPCGSSDSFCTSGTSIGVQSVSRLPGCWSLLDFTYFLSIVTVPVGVDVNTFTIDFTLMDDGSRITIYNSQNTYPDNGVVVPGSYVALSNSATVNLASYVITGVNYVVITQVDDCAVGNNINAIVSLNGQAVPPVCNPPDACHTAAVNANNMCIISEVADGTSCDDGNLCTQLDVCVGGTCTGSDPVQCGGGKPGRTCGTGAYGSVCNPATGKCSKKRALELRKK